MDLSIVVPVYNEESSIEKELDLLSGAMHRTDYAYEVIVVDDGSTDRSRQILSGRKDIKLLRNDINRGVGIARKMGTQAAQGRLIAWTDADMTYPNEEIPALIRELEEKAYDQIIGWRDCERGKWRYLRALVKSIIRYMVFIIAGIDAPDLNSGLRVFKREMASPFLELLPRGFSCTSTLTLIFACNGRSVGYYPIEYRKRSGKSKFNPVRDTYRCVEQILRVILYFTKRKPKHPGGS